VFGFFLIFLFAVELCRFLFNRAPLRLPG